MRMATFAAVCIAAFAAAGIGLAHAADLHVSPEGSDQNSGLDAGSAFKSIQAAVNKAQPGDTVLVHAGTYRETVIFPRSGTAQKPIALRPAGTDKVTISGCDVITGWTKHSDTIWKAPMPWTLGLGRNQVFDGEGVLIEARFPNEPAEGLGMYVAGLSPLWPTFGEFSIPKETMQKQPGRIVSKLLEGQPDDYWKGACYYGVHYEGWTAQTGVIESSKSGEIQVGDRTPTWWFGPAYGGNYGPEEGRGMIVGHIHALDRATEWVWQDGSLLLMPRHPGEPKAIEAKRRQVALDLSGREYVSIEGINVVGASMRLDGSAHCTVDRCDLSYISHFTRLYSTGQIEREKDTIRSGETGIFLAGHDNAFTNCSVRISAGAGFHLRGYHQTIHNCLIDEVDYTSHYLNAITDAVGDYGQYENTLIGGHAITFNTMRNAGRHFFNFNGNGTSTSSRDRKPTDYMATLFAHNHLYNGMLETRDAGFITGYHTSGGTLNGLHSQVVYNVMHDCYDIAAMRWGVLGIVYLDNGSADVDVCRNLLWAAPGSLQRGIWFNPPCVNVRDEDNLFHPMFSRTSPQLQDSDFPGGKPIRFGHDFENPPPIPQWPPVATKDIPVSAFTAFSKVPTLTEAGALTNLKDGDALCVGNVDFDEGWRTALMKFSTDAKQINSDHSNRQRPRHQKVTDPLVMEAEHNDGQHEKLRKLFDFIYNTTDGSWMKYNQVPLGEGYRKMRVVYGNTSPGARWAELHMDRADGPMVAKVDLKVTDHPRKDHVQIYTEAVVDLSPEAKGTHDLVMVFRSEDGKSAGDFEYFRLEGYRGQIPLAKNEVKIELRVDGKDGEKIGEFYPRYSGGDESFLNLVAKLDPPAGKHELYAVVRSSLDRPIGNVQMVSLQRPTWSGGDIAGVGVPPLKDAAGRFVYPQATNVPIARPADKYAQPSNGARPTIVASRLPKNHVLDGKVTQWDAARGYAMKESPGGDPTAGIPSVAWVAYDDEAMYVAMNHPVTDPGTLAGGAHQWGSTDGAEVAIQDGLSAKPGEILSLHGYPDGVFEATEDAGASTAAAARLQKSVTYKSAMDGAGWSCEWRIPFAACGFTPRSAPRLLFNLGAFKKSQKAWVILHGTGGPTYNVARGATLVFTSEFVSSVTLPKEKLAVWLDAADGDSVIRDAAGAVSVWKDKSGTGHDARQEAAENRPRYSPAGINGKPSLTFDEKRRTRLELPDLAPEKISATIFAVFSNPIASTQGNHDPRIFTASDGKGYDYQIGLCSSVSGMETGGPRQMMTVASDRWAKMVRVGCFSPNVQTFLTGDIAEILVYTRALTPAETDIVRDYLAVKWELK